MSEIDLDNPSPANIERLRELWRGIYAGDETACAELLVAIGISRPDCVPHRREWWVKNGEWLD